MRRLALDFNLIQPGSSSLAENWRLSRLPQCLSAEDVERLIAACDGPHLGRLRDRAIAELLRRLNGGKALELVSSSVAALEDVEISPITSGVYEFGHVAATGTTLRAEDAHGSTEHEPSQDLTSGITPAQGLPPSVPPVQAA